VVKADVPCARQLIDVYNKYEPAAVVAVQEVPIQEISRYGAAKLKPNTDRNELEHIVEKPSPANAPSNLAQLGRFVLSYRTIEVLEEITVQEGNELWLTDAIDRLAATDSVIVHPIEGKWFTTGDPLRFLQTTVEFALDRPDIGPDFARFLQELDLSRFNKD
jgi:UTP--glucose-1-phosphate uridylyltransferase